MTIKYYLQDNKLTPDPREQRAIVKTNGHRTLDDLIDEAMDRGTLVTRTDITAVLHLFFQVYSDYAAKGYSISTPLISTRPVVKGTFDSVTATFDPSQHEVKVSCVPGTLLRDMMKKASVQKITTTERLPRLLELHDQLSDTYNEQITPGGFAILAGSRLSFDPKASDEGIFFISADGIESQVTQVARNKPAELIFLVPPSLSSGTYSLVQRSRLGGTNLREGNLSEVLEVK